MATAPQYIQTTPSDVFNLINSYYRQCLPYQYARELLQNSLDAGATDVDFVIEPQANKLLEVQRLAVIDNGIGMDLATLENFTHLGCTTRNGNFGIGAKVTTIPWTDIVIVTYQNGKGLFARIRQSGNTYIVEDLGKDPSDISDPNGIRWNKVLPERLKNHGTAIILTGRGKSRNTIEGDSSRGERKSRDMLQFLNGRYRDLSNINVHVFEPYTDGKRRRVDGALHFVAPSKMNKAGGGLQDKGIIFVDKGRVKVEYYLWNGDKSNVSTYGVKDSAIFLQSGVELYDRMSHIADFAKFGLSEVSKEITLIITPPPAKVGGFGVEPNDARSELVFTKGRAVSSKSEAVSEWGAEFRANLPDSIRKRIKEKREDETAFQFSVSKRLEQLLGGLKARFSDAFRAIQRDADALARDTEGSLKGSATNFLINVKPTNNDDDDDIEGKGPKGRKGPSLVAIPTTALKPGAQFNARKVRSGNSTLPEVKFESGKHPDNDTLGVQWLPERGQVVIYRDCPFVRVIFDVIEREYPDNTAEVLKRAEAAIMEHVGATVYHIQSTPMTDDNRARLLSPEALTVSMAGVLALDQYITWQCKNIAKRTKG